jgi:hypothetical protein
MAGRDRFSQPVRVALGYRVPSALPDRLKRTSTAHIEIRIPSIILVSFTRLIAARKQSRSVSLGSSSSPLKAQVLANRTSNTPSAK